MASYAQMTVLSQQAKQPQSQSHKVMANPLGDISQDYYSQFVQGDNG
jgi:hypothetical protein